MRMMKVAVLVAAVAMSASVVHVANAGTMTFGLGGGIASPSGDFSDFAKLGFNGNVSGDYWVRSNCAIGIDVDGNFFGGKDDLKNQLKAAFPAYPDPKVTATLIGGSVHGTYAFPMKDAPVAPWVQVGLGEYNAKAKIEKSDPTVNQDASETDFGWYGGAGFDMKAGDSMKWGIDAKYHQVQTKGKSSSFITAGVHLTFMTSGTTK